MISARTCRSASTQVHTRGNPFHFLCKLGGRTIFLLLLFMEELDDSRMNELVLNYLIHHCFPDTAQLLLNSTNLTSKNEIKSVASITERASMASAFINRR